MFCGHAEFPKSRKRQDAEDNVRRHRDSRASIQEVDEIDALLGCNLEIPSVRHNPTLKDRDEDTYDRLDEYLAVLEVLITGEPEPYDDATGDVHADAVLPIRDEAKVRSYDGHFRGGDGTRIEYVADEEVLCVRK